jgi:SpoVK/Ycf46/Vps4 family AAA+-type ATPase
MGEVSPPPLDDLGWFKVADYSKRAVMRYNPVRLSEILNETLHPEERKSQGDDNFYDWGTPRLTASQQQVLQKLNVFYNMKRRGCRVASISGRPIPLVIAPSGTGKTYLIQHFATINHLPLLSLDASSWIVQGATSTPHTIDVIRKFVKTNYEGILFLDELDKFTAESDWCRHLQAEVLSLLDGGARGYESFSAEEKRKLQEQFFICGCGTWQHLYQTAGKSLGFGGTSTFSVEDEVVKQAGIPYELLARFNSNLLVLKPPTQNEFAEWIRDIHEELLLTLPPSIERLAAEAVQSQLNTRWLEAYVSKLFLDGKEQVPNF